MNKETIMKYLRDAVPLGEHPTPHAEFITIRLDVVQAAADAIEESTRFRQDAARYRYLRNPNTMLVVSGMVVDGLSLTTLPQFEQQLDDAIDSKLDRLELK